MDKKNNIIILEDITEPEKPIINRVEKEFDMSKFKEVKVDNSIYLRFNNNGYGYKITHKLNKIDSDVLFIENIDFEEEIKLKDEKGLYNYVKDEEGYRGKTEKEKNSELFEIKKEKLKAQARSEIIEQLIVENSNYNEKLQEIESLKE